MFKKKPSIKPSAPLRSSDRRKLADQIIDAYQINPSHSPQSLPEDLTPEQKAETTAARSVLRTSLLPDNLQSARFTTTHGPELKPASGTVYIGSHDGEETRILWFQLEGRMYPSVYTLWRQPDLVPLLHTPDMVVRKLQGGANLMTPGLARGPPFPLRATAGAVVAIASLEHPSVPVAVGTCHIDVSTLQRVQGAKGHAVENMHWAGDELWAYSVNGKSGQDPPEDIEGWLRVLGDGALAEKTGALALDDDADEESGGGVPLPQAGQTSHDAPADGQLNGNHAENSAGDSGATPMTQQEIDDTFRNAFLFAAYHHKTTNPSAANHGLVFPLSQSFVMSALIQPFLPDLPAEQKDQLQIKKTSWKNIKKFIKALDKQKLVKSKEKDGHETVIIDVDFNDPAIASFKPYRLPKKETSSAEGDRPTEAADSASDDALGQTLQVISYFRPTAKLQPLLEAAAGKTLFTASEVREAVAAYIDKEGLLSETNKRLVRLDPTLAHAVFDGSGRLDHEVVAKGAVPRDALLDRVLHAMPPSYAVLRNGAAPASVKPRAGAPPKVHLSLETRSGNKTVTKLSGLEPYHVPARPLADELRRLCAGSAAVEPLAGAAKKHEREVLEVMVQGPQTDAVLRALERRGVPARWVEVVDKTKGKKR